MVEQLKKTKLVGEFIKKKRESLGMSQRALGLVFSPPVTTQFISNVERGVTPLPPTHIPVIASALGASESELMQLLEKEYAQKLNGRLGKVEDTGRATNGNGTGVIPTLEISNGDYEFMKNLYDAIRSADTKTRLAFASVCENVLKLPKSSIAHLIAPLSSDNAQIGEPRS